MRPCLKLVDSIIRGRSNIANFTWFCALSVFLFLIATSTRPVVAQSESTWHVETVDDGKGDNVGQYSYLAVDEVGSIHIAYYDETKKSLRYAFRRNQDKNWSIMDVDKPEGTFVALAVDGLGHPHFAYNSPFETGLHYAYWDGLTWHRALIDSETTNHFISIGLDNSGYPHISYYREEYPDRTYALYLKYAHFDGKTWYVETVDHQMHSGKFNSIAVDSSGKSHIAYSQVEAGDLRYAVWDGANWQFGTADSRRTHNDYVGIGNSIAIDSNGNMCIAYFDTTKRLVKYAWQKDGSWQIEVVDQLFGQWVFVDRVSLKLDSHNRPHIAYYDHGVGMPKYAMRDEKGWHIENVDNRGHVGGYSSLALGPGDQAFFAYYDMADAQLRLATRQVNAPSRPTDASERKP
jgi:hypothetical protein